MIFENNISVTLRSLLALLIVCICPPSSLYAGTLDDFEKDSTKPGQREPLEKHHSTCSHDCDDDNSSLGYLVIRGIVELTRMVFVVGTENTLQRTSYDYSDFGISHRKPGSTLLPNFRLDAQIQNTSNSVFSGDLRTELGEGLLGIQARHTHYWESMPRDQLGITSIHALYRLSFGNTVGLNIGIGATRLEGNNRYTRASFTFPFYWEFGKHFSFEYKPLITAFNGNTFVDNDWSVRFRRGYYSTAMGYRTVSNSHTSLSGIYINTAFHY